MTAYHLKSDTAFTGYDLPNTDTFNGIRRFLANWAAWAEERRAYREAVFELGALTDRNLADIGIARCDIQAVAREAAKANLAERRLVRA